MEELFQYLLTLAPLSEELQAALVTRTVKETHRASKTLLAAGEVCSWIAHVECGLVKVGYDVPGGDERIVQFARAGEAVFGVGSFTTGLPSRMSVVAIEKTVIRKIYKSAIDDLIARFPAFHANVRKIIEAHTQLIEDHYLLHLLPAKERYLNLIQSKSWLLSDRRIKDYMIADYLGFGRSTFSRFRNGKG
jgi:CRP-like cAMP-binding protein